MNVIEKHKNEIKDYLKETIILKRGFVTNLCLISAAVASFSMPLFLLSSLNHYFLFLGIVLFFFVIAVGCYGLKKDLEKDNDSLLQTLRALSRGNFEELQRLGSLSEKREGEKDHIFDFMVYPLILGLISILVAVLFYLIYSPKVI